MHEINTGKLECQGISAFLEGIQKLKETRRQNSKYNFSNKWSLPKTIRDDLKFQPDTYVEKKKEELS